MESMEQRSSSLHELAITTRHAINAGASPRILNDSIFDLKNLINSVGLESEAARRVVELANNGLNISELAEFIIYDTDTGLRGTLLKRLLERGDGREQLEVSSLRNALPSVHFLRTLMILSSLPGWSSCKGRGCLYRGSCTISMKSPSIAAI